MKKNIIIGALISGSGTNLQAILDACNQGKIDGQIVFVGSDNKEAKGLKRAADAGIDTFVVDYDSIIKQYGADTNAFVLPGDFNLNEIKAKQSLIPKEKGDKKIEFFLKSRAIAEKELLDKILPYNIDLLVLAGFMRVLTPYFIDRINTDFDQPKIINIHPALLPAFPGTDGYGDTFRYGCKVGGCTVHFIDYGEDSGRIIGQKAFQIEDNDTLEIVKAKGIKLEWQLYPECIQKFAKAQLHKLKNE